MPLTAGRELATVDLTLIRALATVRGGICAMKVFVSYAHTDEAIAKRVADILHEAGLEVWEATREILPETTGPPKWIRHCGSPRPYPSWLEIRTN